MQKALDFSLGLVILAEPAWETDHAFRRRPGGPALRGKKSQKPSSELANHFSEVRGVLFDVDGTLADSVGLFFEMSRDIFLEADLPMPPRARIYELMSLGDPNPWPKLFPENYENVEELVGRVMAKRRDVWMHRYLQETEALPGGVAFVERLAARGYALGIVTSSQRDLPFLEHWGIRRHFRSYVGREDVENKKPHPEPIERCLRELSLDAAHAVYIGDSRIDIRAALAAGVRAVGVTTGTTEADPLHAEGAHAVVDTLEELDDWFPGC